MAYEHPYAPPPGGPPAPADRQHGFLWWVGTIFVALWLWTISVAVVSYAYASWQVDQLEDDFNIDLLRLVELMPY